MKISNRQIKDMELCEKSNGAKDCFECSANVCLMKYETDLKRIEELEAKATKYEMLRKAFKFDMYDSEGYPLKLGDKVEIANGQVGKIAYECGAFGVVIDDCIDYEGIQNAMDKDPHCCGNRYSGVKNDNFVSFWELYWNSNSDDDVCRFIELYKESEQNESK